MRWATAALSAVGSLLLVVMVSPAAALEPPATLSLRLSTVEDITADLALLDCAEESRYDAVSRLFGRAGAPQASVSEFSRRQVRNLHKSPKDMMRMAAWHLFS